MRSREATPGSPRAARSSSTPASTRGARPRTSSSFASRARRSRIWWGDVNAEISEEHFEQLREKVAARLSEGDVYVVDAFAGADPAHRIAVRVITESPWHALFAKTLFIDPTDDELDEMEPQALVLHAPSVSADPDEDGTRTETFVCLHPSRTEVVIGGTFYAGEIKKSIFTVMNDRLPLEGVFPMHCSANLDEAGRVARVLRALRHGEDDALRRSRAAPHRRRRARLVGSTASSTSRAAATRR